MTVCVYLDGGLQEPLWDGMRELAAKRSSLMRWKPMPIRIWLSGAAARPFLFGPIAGLKGWHEAQRVANEMAPELCGISEPCETQIESDPSDTAALVVAVATASLLTLRTRAQEAGLKIISTRPAWTLATATPSINQLGDALLCIREQDATTVLACRGHLYIFVATYLPSTDSTALEAMLRRLQVSLGMPDECVQLVDVRPPVEPFGPPVVQLGAIRPLTHP